MNQKFIPLTEEQLIAAEKGELKLKCRNGQKVLQIMWAKPPFAQDGNDALMLIIGKGERQLHCKNGSYHHKLEPHGLDLFIDHEETAKLNKQEHQMHSVIDDSQYTRLLIGVNTPIPSEQAFGGFDQNTSSHIINNNAMNPLLAHTIEQLNKPVANTVQVIGNAFTELLEQSKENPELNLNGGDSVNENTAVHRQVKSLFDDVKPKCSYGGELTGVPDKVVNLMVKRQVEQGNKEDIAVFERYVRADYDNGGFHWAKTPEKGEKWYDILINKKYDLVPDEIEVVGNKSQYEKGQAIEVYDEIDCTWIEAKFIAFDGDIVVARHEESYYGFELHRPVSVININGKVISLKEASEFINNLLSK